jgi:translocator protein
MTDALPRPATSPGARARSAGVLVLFLLIAFAVAGLGSAATIANVDGWYSSSPKAFWTPPNAVFGPVWTVLYTLMSVSAWLVWRERRRAPAAVRRALAVYVGQLVLNAVWTPLFFGLYPVIGVAALWIALAVIVLLDAAVLAAMLAFWPVRRAAAWLLVPYWAWVLYATTLNAAIIALQR